jgi:hypothetical protein
LAISGRNGGSADLLRGLLAWRIQERAYGGLSAETERRLQDLARNLDRIDEHPPSPLSRLMPGTVLVREWRGEAHRVTIERSGFSYQGKHFKDLSTIARTITGTRWSGPRFFGLTPK